MSKRESHCPFCAQSLTTAADAVVFPSSDQMKPFLVNGYLYGWAWKDDPTLIIQTLALPAQGHA
jgi:hypothetical protein